jgi:hypothetical protein
MPQNIRALVLALHVAHNMRHASADHPLEALQKGLSDGGASISSSPLSNWHTCKHQEDNAPERQQAPFQRHPATLIPQTPGTHQNPHAHTQATHRKHRGFLGARQAGAFAALKTPQTSKLPSASFNRPKLTSATPTECILIRYLGGGL